MEAALIVLGALVLTVAGVDVLWTVLAAGSGAGPLTGRVSAFAWRVGLALSRRTGAPRHTVLAVFGQTIVVSMLLSWAAAAFVGWLLIAASADGAVRVAETDEPASLVERAYFVGFNLFTLGTDTFSAGDGLWQLFPLLTGASGLVLLSLGIGYIVPIASAVAERRQLAQYVVSLGSTPETLVVRMWSDEGLSTLSEHLIALTPMVHLASERHLTYPSVAYFHSGRDEASSSISVAVLDDAVTLLCHGVAPDARPDAAVLQPLRVALDVFLQTVGGGFVSSESDPFPTPELQPLRDAGIPTVDDEVFAEAVEGELERRRLLTGLLANDGWSIDQGEERRRALARS